MKKLFLFLVLFAWTDVSAETKYTPYELQEYTKQKPEEDEFHRYEKMILNRFYKETKTDEVYLEGLDLLGYDKVDETDFYTRKTLRETPMPGYKNEQRIVVYAETDYQIDKIWFDEAPNFFDRITKLEIFSKNTPINYTSKIDDNSIEIDLGETYNYLDLNFYIEYTTDEDYSFRYRIIRPSGNYVQNKIVLSKDFNDTTIYTLIGEEFQRLIQTHYITFHEVIRYYLYERTFYKHYNLKRVYYKDSEETGIEGYTYDPKETYTIYKVYKREKIEETQEPEKPQEPDSQIPPNNEDEDSNSSDEKPNIDTSIDNSENNPDNIIDDKADTAITFPKEEENRVESNNTFKKDDIQKKTPTLITYNTTNVYKYDTSNTGKNIDDEEKDKKKIPELNCNCNFPDNLLLKDETRECQKNTRAEILKSIGEILLIIALLQVILYGFSVKRKNKNG